MAKSEIVNKPEKKKHIIHRAVKWKKMLDGGSVNSMSEIARKEGLMGVPRKASCALIALISQMS
jgi:hypothetical protein